MQKLLKVALAELKAANVDIKEYPTYWTIRNGSRWESYNALELIEFVAKNY